MAQGLNDLARIRLPLRNRSHDQSSRQLAQVFLGDPVEFWMERRVARRRAAQRVDLGVEVAEFPNRLREIHGADDLGAVAALYERRL